MRTSDMPKGMFHLKDYQEAMTRYRDEQKPVWGAWTEQEGEPATRSKISHWVETPVSMSEPQAKEAVKKVVEAKTGQRVAAVVYDP